MDVLGPGVEFIQESVERALQGSLDVMCTFGPGDAQYFKQNNIVVLGIASGDHVEKPVIDLE